jgi:hypothetical protein
MLLNIVNDEELVTSQIVKGILLIILISGIIYNLYRFFREGSPKIKKINFALFVLLMVFSMFVFKTYRIESGLLKSPEYVTGITSGYCSVFALGAGIEFEYQVNGQQIRRCNTYHPISKDSIVAIGGKYKVRFSKEFPEEGRMNFKMRIE